MQIQWACFGCAGHHTQPAHTLVSSPVGPERHRSAITNTFKQFDYADNKMKMLIQIAIGAKLFFLNIYLPCIWGFFVKAVDASCGGKGGNICSHRGQRGNVRDFGQKDEIQKCLFARVFWLRKIDFPRCVCILEAVAVMQVDLIDFAFEQWPWLSSQWARLHWLKRSRYTFAFEPFYCLLSVKDEADVSG